MSRTWTFFFAEFFVNVARGALLLSLGMYLYRETGSLWAFAANVVIEFVVVLMLQGWAGTFVDRYGAKRILLVTTAASFLLPVLCSVVVNFNLVLVLTIVIQILNAFKPFIRNSIFTLVTLVAVKNNIEQLNARLSIAIQGGQIGGMLMAGVLIEFGDIPLTLYFVGGLFLLAFIAFYRLFFLLEKTSSEEERKPKVTGNWRDAIIFVTQSRQAKIILLIASFDFAAIALFNLMLAPVVKLDFNDQPMWLTILDLSFAVGAIIAGFTVGKWDWSHKPYYTAVTLMSAVLVFLSFATHYGNTPIIFTIVLFGACITYSTVFWGSELQRLSPSPIKGRIASLRYISNATPVTFVTLLVSWIHSYRFEIALISIIFICLVMSSIAIIMGFYYRQLIEHKRTSSVGKTSAL
jgi:MFS family permease